MGFLWFIRANWKYAQQKKYDAKKHQCSTQGILSQFSFPLLNLFRMYRSRLTFKFFLKAETKKEEDRAVK